MYKRQAGQLGAEPIAKGTDFLISINAQGRLRTAQEFGNVVLKIGAGGEVVRLSDVARIELGANDYTSVSYTHLTLPTSDLV